jgi:hypothetical protein
VTLSRLLRVAAKLCLIGEGLSLTHRRTRAVKTQPVLLCTLVSYKGCEFASSPSYFFTLSVQPELYRLLQYTVLISEPF